MDCMDDLIKKLRGEDSNSPKEKINAGEADEMVIQMLISRHLSSGDNIWE